MLAQVEDIGILAHPAQVDELGDGLLRDAVDIHALLRDKARELLELLGRALDVGAVERACAAGLTAHHLGGGATYWTDMRNEQMAHLSPHVDDLRNDLVGLDDLQFGTLVTDAQSLALADVAQRGTLDGGALELYGAEHRHGRDGGCRTAPLDVVELGQRTLVLPFEGHARPRGVVSRHRARLRIVGVVEGDDQSVNGVGVTAVGHLLCPTVDHGLYVLHRRLVDTLVVHRAQSVAGEPVHALSPRGDVAVGMHQREGNPADVSLCHLGRVFERERSRCQVAGVGIAVIVLHVEPLEVFVRDHCLAAHHHVPLVVDPLGYAADGLGQMRDVGTNVSVAPRHHLVEAPIVVGHHECQSVEFPREPDGSSLGPFGQVGGFLGLGQREGLVFVFLLLSGDVVFRHLLRGRVGQRLARLLLQPLQFVELRVPLIVGHQLLAAVVICVRGAVELLDQRLHLFCLVHAMSLLVTVVYPDNTIGKGRLFP